ncbi:hypothetical protein KGF86_01785 [Ornithinibacillus massiliensis]|uniref:Uncharacterized protein n=1 Tax=Ornithinibacillus massiliensis TaxID=1944633 RepID=A0ABS5M9V8_9BACI|nr:hypothetical protein [Ornithinibacillus massiliensis]MBS3678935.1 hypothetical protein [Ornithinibacillus massiliensis]
MEKMSIKNLIEVNKMYKSAVDVKVLICNDYIIIRFYDELGFEDDATVLTFEEYELVKKDYYINLI